jgi:methionine synthase II (cobalamin-independent)
MTDDGPDRPWPPGAATGIGSLRGTDPAEAARLVFDELPDLPHLPELPDRGSGAELIGRSAALLIDLPVEIGPSGWRLTARPGRDLRRARDFLAHDLDDLERAGEGYRGALKVQAAGPWTLAAGLELPSGHRAVSDPGAVRDLAASLADGIAAHLEQVERRLPGTSVVLQLDEPSLPAVLAGTVPTPSGWGTVRAVDSTRARDTLRDVLQVAGAGARAVHCCAVDVPITLLHEAGAEALSIDGALITERDYDELAEAIDTGLTLWLGVLPGIDSEPAFDAARTTANRLASALGIAPADRAATIVPTPACGLAGASNEHARRALAVVRDVGSWLLDGTDG